MNKSELLVWLADHLDGWPKKERHGPMITNWLWKKDLLGNAIYLERQKFKLTGTLTKVSFSEWRISETEWLDECDRSLIPDEPIVPPKVEAMIDIETLDITDKSAVFQVAIVMFDENHVVHYRETWNLDIDEQFKQYRTVSASTLAFHLGIPSNTKAALEDENIVSMNHFSDDLIRVFEMNKPSKVWSKGNFDFNVLNNFFTSIDKKVPWEFRQARELRTLMSECGVPKGEAAHNALDDCMAQIEQLDMCRAVIRGDADSIPDAEDIIDQETGRTLRIDGKTLTIEEAMLFRYPSNDIESKFEKELLSSGCTKKDIEDAKEEFRKSPEMQEMRAKLKSEGSTNATITPREALIPVSLKTPDIVEARNLRVDLDNEATQALHDDAESGD